MPPGISGPPIPLQTITNLPVFFISLPHSKRRPIIASRLDQQNIQSRFIDAITGSSLPDAIIADVSDDDRIRRRMGRSLNRNEICCALSHREAYRHIIETRCDGAFILEDDAIPTPALNTLLENLETTPKSVKLLSIFKGSGIIHHRGAYQVANVKHVRAATTIECSYGYFIRRQTAIKLFVMTKNQHRGRLAV